MRNSWRVLIAISALSIGSVLVEAQSARKPDTSERPPERRDEAVAPSDSARTRGRRPASAPERKPGVPEAGLRFLSSEMSFSGKVVKHVPYSAETLTENTRTLGNGAKITQRTTGMVYRDDE